MIEDKSLKRAIKTAVKHGGCCMWINRETDNVDFWTDEWRAATDSGELRAHLRESMALIVEMLGYLPERPVKIFKGNGEYMEAGIMPEMAEAELNSFDGPGLDEVKYLPMSWRGHHLCMTGRTGLYFHDGGAPFCLCKKRYINGNDCIAATDEDNGEGVFVRAFTRHTRYTDERDKQAELLHLGSFAWVSFDEESPDMEQMEVEEDE